MRFGVLGPLAVWTDAGEPVPVPGAKVRLLLADLLAHQGRPVSTDRLIEDLWGETPPANAAGALQVRVSQLRRALSDAEPAGRDLVVSRPPGYQLVVTADAVDAGRFATMAGEAAATGDPRARAALLADALALWRGDAYADVADEEFARGAVTRLEEQRLAVLEQQAEARLELGEHRQLAGELAGLVVRYPLRERLRAAHLRALYGAGRQSEALDGYADLRSRLADELGLDPSPELVALHRAILGQDPALAAPVAPAAAPRRASNLPAPLAGLVGRERALDEVHDLLGAARLVTLTGSGGVGKTRLAVEVARTLVDDLPDGAWLVELAAVDRAGPSWAVAERVLEALDIREVADPAAATQTAASDRAQPGIDMGQAGTSTAGTTANSSVRPADRLVGALRDRRLLLVLDNCEHVIDRAAELAGSLLRGAPGLRVLATSREPLGVAGEVTWDVPPLGVPDPAAGADPDLLVRSAAVRLFVDRASAAHRGFALDGSTAPAVAQVVRRLDGIPLALELAATRVRGLGVDGLVARLDDRFRLLATGHRGAPPRQQTLAAVIDWSWELLTGPERAVLRRLAGHADGCTVDAAEAVCGFGDVPAEEVLDLLVRLVDRSLVVLDDRPGRPARYRLLESVAAYCADRLAEAGEADTVRDRHGRYYTDLAERAGPQLYGPEQRAWLHRLDDESANLHAAFDAALRPGPAARALRLAVALAWYRFLRGRLTEARRSLREALAVAGTAPAALRARGRAWEVGFALLQGDTADWPARRDSALRAYADVDDPGGQARAEWFLGFVGADVGDLAVSETLVDRALATFREMGDRWGTAAALSARAKLAHVRGDLDALGRAATESGQLFEAVGDRWGMLQASDWLGGQAEMSGEYDRASRLHTDGLRLAEELELWPDIAAKLSWLGWIAVQVGDHARARELCEHALRLAAEQDSRPARVFAELGIGFAARRDGKLDLAETYLRGLLADAPPAGADGQPLHVPMVLVELGFAAELRGDAVAAAELHLRAFAMAQRMDAPRDATGAVEGLAGATALAGGHARAAALLGAADAARRATGLPPAPTERADLDRITDRVRAGLGDQAFDEAFASGAALTPAVAVTRFGRAGQDSPVPGPWPG